MESRSGKVYASNLASKGIGATRNFMGTKRMRKLTKDNIRALTKGDIRRLARRGGVKRISGSIYDEIRNTVKSYLKNVLKEICDVVEHGQRKTVIVNDVIFVLKRLDRPIYGFDQYEHVRKVNGSH
ncbi:BgTH12-00277 [Blumeria graminis f. sp. triticale]|uniref:Histone H4 n=3 Tax=Blumeria graminis TaxID=34373 RepID=A0A381LIC8_BLUGR|nr:histone H4 protein [Blumeria graminis f. sp. tritici 96224]CAD6504774.1 BgTH12-00277 [Blumeria graminis f. sp. triticale]VDB92799.1 Bgt-1677 [Blumeria graminis f. sp. tritici]